MQRRKKSLGPRTSNDGLTYLIPPTSSASQQGGFLRTWKITILQQVTSGPMAVTSSSRCSMNALVVDSGGPLDCYLEPSRCRAEDSCAGHWSRQLSSPRER